MLSINHNHEQKQIVFNDSNLIDIKADEFTLLNVSNVSLEELAEQQSYKIILDNDKSYEIIPTTKKFYSKDLFSVIGYFKEYGEKSKYFSTFTYSSQGLIGDFYLPNGHYKVDIISGENILLNPRYFNNHLSDFPFNYDQDLSDKFIYNHTSNIKNEEKNKVEKTTLNVAIIISESAGDFNSAKASMINAFNLGQAQLLNSNVDITLSLKLISPVKSEFDINLNDSIHQANATLHIEGLNMIDLESQDTETFPSTITEFNIHHFILAIGSSGADTGCGFSGPQRVFDNFSTYRLGVTPGGVCPQITLIHEIGHNLTLIHADGACTEFDADPGSVCESIDPPPDKSSVTSYEEAQGGEIEWRTVMRSSGKGANFFTGGLDNSVSSGLCSGVCNTEPFEDHDSIGILNQARLTAVNNFIEVVMPVVPPVINPDIYENDDILSFSKQMPINGGFQLRNFDDDTVDWIVLQGESYPNTNGCPRYSFCNFKVQGITEGNICYQNFNNDNSPSNQKVCNISNGSVYPTIKPNRLNFGSTCHQTFSTNRYYKITEESGLPLGNKDYQIKLECSL